MRPETVELLAYARKLLADASTMLDSGLPDHAARTAYLACFHAARAYMFERGSTSAKTHRGVQTEFLRLSRDDARCDVELRVFLSKAYRYKTSSDYEPGPSDVVSPADARAAVTMAARFVAAFADLTPLPG